MIIQSLKKFRVFAHLSTVSQDPSDLAARHVAVDSGKAVTNSIRTAASGIIDLRDLVQGNVEANVVDFNNKIIALNGIQRDIGKCSKVNTK